MNFVRSYQPGVALRFPRRRPVPQLYGPPTLWLVLMLADNAREIDALRKSSTDGIRWSGPISAEPDNGSVH